MDPMAAREEPAARGGVRKVLAIGADATLGVLLMLAVPCVILLLFLPVAAGLRLLIEVVKRL